jgi:hypothetical protein
VNRPIAPVERVVVAGVQLQLGNGRNRWRFAFKGRQLPALAY